MFALILFMLLACLFGAVVVYAIGTS